MSKSIASSAARTHANPVQPHLQDVHCRPVKAETIHTNLQPAGIDVNPAQPEDILMLIDHVRSECGLSQKTLALTAREQGCSESALSDALRRQNNRVVNVEWLWAQDDLFVDKLTTAMRRARGLCERSTRELEADRAAELVRLIFLQRTA